MSYIQLTVIERAQLEVLVQQGHGIRSIGRILQRSASWISRELWRNPSAEGYQTKRAQEAYRGKGTYTPELAAEIQHDLEQTFSREQIEHSRKRQGKSPIGFKTIYTWLYTAKLQGSLQVLRHKSKRRKPPEKRGRFALGKSIHQRPKEVRNRKSFGHWELDTVV